MGTLAAKLEERIDENTRRKVRDEVAGTANEADLRSTAPLPSGRLARWLEQVLAQRLGSKELAKLAEHRGEVTAAWRHLPDRMHLVANQTKLMMELVDDFRSGAYRKISWRSMAMVVFSILYVANPADVLPDWITGLGALDDIAVAALTTRMLRGEIRAYCEHKGYDPNQYFAVQA